MSNVVPWADTDRRIGATAVLFGADAGRYPFGNSVMVQGSEGVVMIDPSLSLVARGGAPAVVDRILVSHAHEDHFCGAHVFPDASVHVHHADAPGLRTLDGFLDIYGMPDPMRAQWAEEVVEKFFFTSRANTIEFEHGDTFDLGTVRVEVVHLPGHTRGHSGFLIEPDGVFFVADIDLSTFGPYYGDHWSDLEDFERSIAACREIDARHYATFHHKGVVDSRPDFLDALDRFAAVIAERDAKILTFLCEPHTLEEMVEHRFVYRPNVDLMFASHVERRTATLHLERLLSDGAVIELSPGLYRAA